MLNTHGCLSRWCSGQDARLVNAKEGVGSIPAEVIPQKCSKSYSLLCFKLDIIKYVNKLSDKQEIQLIPGVYLEKIVKRNDEKDRENSSRNEETPSNQKKNKEDFPNLNMNNRNKKVPTKLNDKIQENGHKTIDKDVKHNGNHHNILSITGRPEEQLQKYEKIGKHNVAKDRFGGPKHQLERVDKDSTEDDNNDDYDEEGEDDEGEDDDGAKYGDGIEKTAVEKGLDKIDVDFYTHLLSQNKSGGPWLSAELLDEEFLDYLARKFDRYFRTRNLKIQIVESVKKIDREVFGGILPTAESGRRGTATYRKKSKIPLSFIITIAAALGLILLKILAAKTILLSKLALLLAGLQFFKSGHGGSSKYTGSTTTLSDGGKSNIEIATAKRRNSECAVNAALVTHYNEGVRSVAANEAAGAATIGLGDSILVGQPMSGHVNYDYNRRNVLQRADYFDPYVQEDPKLFVPNDFY
ncbi:hypothetical protein M8J77_007833 [Diaphorina citri]|nr:hypothetical protein M8J77_007833 [Diaphorina citri]